MKILIVDDEALVRKSLGRACRARGHEVIEASDGLEGLNRWRETLPDLVFLDILMPGLSGPEVLQAVAKDPAIAAGRRARVILISAYSGEHDVGGASGGGPDAPTSGADLFIPKPFDDIFAIVAKAESLVSPP